MLDQENICLSVEKKQRDYKSVAPEIVQTSSFQFDDFQHYVDVNMNKKSAYTYTRGENPTLTILEEKLAQLEKGECAKVFASGMGAISATILSLVQQKDHIVIVNTVYGSTVKFIQNLERFGVESTKIDVSSTEDIFAFVKENDFFCYNIAHRADRKGLLIQKEEKTEWRKKEILSQLLTIHGQHHYFKILWCMELILLYILVQNILEDIVIWLVALSFLIKNIYMKSMNLVKSF